MRSRTLLTLGLILFVGTGHAADLFCWGLLTGDNVRVRSGPSKNHRDMGKLPKGAVVRVIGISPDEGWLRVQAPDSMTVWIAEQYVAVTGARGVLTGDKVRVRVRPDETGEVVTQLSKGAAVKVKGRKGDWLRIAPPASSLAYISAQYVKRMTDTAYVAYRAELARQKAEAERRRREEAHRKAELARKKREKVVFDTADRLLAAELGKDIQARALTRAGAAFQDACKQIRDPALRGGATARLALIRDLQRVQSAIRAKRAPRLSKAKYDELKARYGMAREVDDLRRSFALAQRVHEAEQRRIARAKDRPVQQEGWVSYLGPGAGRRAGATHRIIKDGKVLALVKSSRIRLDAFVGARVCATGKVTGQVKQAGAPQPTQVIDAAQIEVRFP